MAAMLADLDGNEPVREIQPKPLSAQDIAKMLASAFDGHFDNFQELVQLVYRKTAGNPYIFIKCSNFSWKTKGSITIPIQRSGVWFATRPSRSISRTRWPI